MLGKLKKRIARKKNKAVEVEDRQTQTMREKIEGYTEAITFAEAGLQEEAQQVIREELAEKAKVLVVGNEHTFSREVVEYALGFAERMGYEIVALNVGPVPRQSSTLEPFCDILCEQFNAKCQETIEEFRRGCEEKGIPFTHVVKFGEVDDCIKETHEELRRVDFVITEPESCPEEGRVTIPVFCLAHS
ncbi:MAG: universal stress protein [Deltaproteobacteria bacterium]|nr:universal stress protein [Deltaproteobacteria bacterium]MBW2070955.1 universal stress protein [Deltaproteobacteria bacterium]